MLYTTSPTRQSEQRNNWSRLSLYGLAYGSKSASGRKLVCLRCQAAKVHRHSTAPVDQFVPATRRFDHIHVDIVGLLPPSQNNRCLLTVVDRFTRWPEAIPLVDAQTTTCAKALALHWIARFGVPAKLTSDRGSQFTSELWATLSQLNGTRLHRTTAYHPQSNGIVERFHRHLKSALKTRLTGPEWIDEPPWVLLGIRTVPKEDLEFSSADMVYGAPLTVPGDFLRRGQDTEDVAHFLPRLRETVRHLVLLFHIVRNRHLCRLRSPTAVSCSSDETVTARRSRRLTRAPTRCCCTAISRVC